MIMIRHSGLYVREIERLESFYKVVFNMIPICSCQPDKGELLDELLGIPNAKIVTTKLVTDYGKQNGQGDMLELVKVLNTGVVIPELPIGHPISMIGMGHVAFGVDDMKETVARINRENGSQETQIYVMRNGNLCCFCRDPEGNWLELIKRENRG